MNRQGHAGSGILSNAAESFLATSDGAGFAFKGITLAGEWTVESKEE